MSQAAETPAPIGPLRRLLVTNDQRLALAGLLAVTALAWVYLADFARHMGAMRAAPAMGAMAIGPMSAPAPVMALSFGLLAAMWAVMMAAMMLPSAAPMILLYGAFRGPARRAPAPGIALFALGYALVWIAFALAAAGLQLGLSRLAALTPQMALASRRLGAGLLIGAGLWELSPLKAACLRHCRSPFVFLMSHWRGGALGALRMGLAHGFFCLGCCWALMLLLFVGGVMSLLWIAALAAVVLLQKLLPYGFWSARITGAAAILAGLVILVR